MKTGTKTIFSAMLGALSAAILLAPLSLAGVLTEPESQLVLECKNNVMESGAPLSPQKAAECVDLFNAENGALMDKFKADSPVQAVEVVSRNNALVDLRSMIIKYRGVDLEKSLSRVIENKNCVPCKMGLGPEPEKLSGWVKAAIPGREYDYNWSIRSWETMGKGRTEAMSRPDYNQTPASWGRLKLQERYEKLYDWAKKETDRLVLTAAMAAKNKEAAAGYSAIVAELKSDLEPFRDWERIRKLNAMLAAITNELAAGNNKQPSAYDKQSKELSAAAKSLAAAQAAGGEKDYLDRGFDNAAVTGNAALPGVPGKKGFAPVAINGEQAARLTSKMATVKGGKMQGYLAAELKGTRVGDEIISFYESPEYAAKGGNKMSLGFQKGEGELKGAIGWWSGAEKVLRINTDVVDDFTKARAITPEQLLNDDKLMKDFATHVAPVFVHESTHQRQTAWTAAKGLDYYKNRTASWAPYQMEQETEAFSMGAAFVAEKAKKGGAAYLGKIPWWDRADAEKYLEDGVDGLRTQKHTYDYYAKHTDSIPGAASKELQAAAYSAKMVDYFETKAKTGALSESDSEKLSEHKQILDTRFSWYKQVLKKSKNDELKLLEWRSEIDAEGNVIRTLKTYRIAPLGGG